MRKFAFALLAIFFATASFAQDVQDVQDDQTAEATEAVDTAKVTKAFSWGIKVNLNLASERNAPENNARTGFAAGFFAEVRLNDRFSLQPEILYSQQGSRQYLNGISTKGDLILEFDYINMPLLLKAYVWEDKLSIEAGPQFGYMVRHKEKHVPKDGAKVTRTIDEDWLNKLDVAAVLGVSYKAYGPFDLYARYTYGFMKTFDGDLDAMIDFDPDKRDFVDVKNSVFQLGVAARF